MLLLVARRDNPEENLATEAEAMLRVAGLQSLFFVRLPIAHVESIGNDPGTRFQLSEQLWTQTQVDLLEEKQRHDAGVTNSSLEQIILFEADQIFHARFLGVLFRIVNTLRVDVDAYAVRPVDLGGRNNDPAIAAAEIVNHIGRFHVGEFQNRNNCFVRGWYVRNFGSAGLSGGQRG